MHPKIKSLLISLDRTREKYWNISSETAQFLNLLIKDRKYKTVLEIGSSNGYSGIWMAEALSHTNGHLYTIESNEERFDAAAENFKSSGLSKYITQILGHAPEDFPQALDPLDLAFFDATKSEHQSYFHTIAPHIKKGGIIITDNTITHRKDLLPFINSIKSDPEWQSTELKLGDGILLSVKSV